jgi:RsiW-degrading membrane proteinase PrsW (M82 family)
MRCDHCANDVPDGVFCTRCGAHQGRTGELGSARTRRHSYAAHPGEHVVQPSIFTTLFPHLGQGKVHEFRWAFAVGLAGVLVLYVAGLITAAILVAVFLVPVLYLIYLYEAQVYRDEPATVLGFTIGGGLVAGIALTLLERALYNPYAAIANPLHNTGVGIGTLLFLGVVVPVVQEAAKPLPALLANRVDLQETVDGLVLGVAAGLGFSVAESMVGFSTLLTSLPPRVDPGNWIYALATLAIFQPLLQGTATGMVVAAVWRYRRGSLSSREVGGVAVAVIAHVAFALGSLLLAGAPSGLLLVLVWQAIVVGAALIYIRVMLHHALLEEAAHMGFAETVCANCHMHIVASGFCPNCGMALTAAPIPVKRARRPAASRAGDHR